MKIMKKFILLLTLAGVIISTAISQTTAGEEQLRTQIADSTEGWKKGGIITINLTQTSLTNWAAGGQNALSANGLISVYANYKKGKNLWSNTLDVGYGILKQGKDADFIKTDDKIDFLSKYGRKAAKHWYYTALLNFKTQMHSCIIHSIHKFRIKWSIHSSCKSMKGFSIKPYHCICSPRKKRTSPLLVLSLHPCS